MSRISTLQLLAAGILACACGPDSSDPLADASWVVGRYAAGAGCSFVNGGTIEGYIIGCTTTEFAEVEFFADGRVESAFFGCLSTQDDPYRREVSRWHATSEDGVVRVEPAEPDVVLSLFSLSAAMEQAEVRRTDDCFQVYAADRDDPALSWAILHRGEFEYFDPFPSDGCEMEARAASVPECPYDEDG